MRASWFKPVFICLSCVWFTSCVGTKSKGDIVGDGLLGDDVHPGDAPGDPHAAGDPHPGDPHPGDSHPGDPQLGDPYMPGDPNTAGDSAPNPTTYYVNNQLGACADSGAGTSPSQPWCSFAPVNARRFGPGDKVLLARGASWNQELDIEAAGTAEALFELGAYGSGPRPRVLRDGHRGATGPGTMEGELQRAVFLRNPSHVWIHGLEIGFAAVGLHLFYDQLSNEDIRISNLYVHHIRGIHETNRFWAYTDMSAGGTVWPTALGCHEINRGEPQPTPPRCLPSQTPTLAGVYNSSAVLISVHSDLTIGASDHVARDIHIHNIEGTKNQNSISIGGCSVHWVANGSAVPTVASNAFQNLRLHDLYLHEDDGVDGQATGCSDGLSLRIMTNVVLYNSILRSEGGCKTVNGTAAVLVSGAKNMVIANNLIHDVPDTNSCDQSGVDFEFANEDIDLVGNYLGTNAGSGAVIQAFRNANSGDFERNIFIENNTFTNNALAQTAYDGGLRINSSAFIPAGVVRNNLYFGVTGTTAASEPYGGFSYGDTSQMVWTNNRRVSSGSSLVHMGAHFAGTMDATGIRYQDSDGSNWHDLTYAGSAWQSVRNAEISRFNVKPGDCAQCAAARVWVASDPMTVGFRGHALKSDLGGNGVTLQATLNGTLVWGPVILGPNDQSGVATVAEGIAMNASDILRLEVHANGDSSLDRVSWMPALFFGGGNLIQP